MREGISIMALIVGSTFLLFGALFCVIGYQMKSVAYLRFFGRGFLLAAFGFGVQKLFLPPDINMNSLLATAVYAAAAMQFAEGSLNRSGQSFGQMWRGVFFFGLMAITGYYLYADPDLLARTYSLSFAFGGILLVAAWKLFWLDGKRLSDKVLIVTLIVVGLHFFPRVLMTAASFSSETLGEIGLSTFWRVLEVSLALMAILGATATLLVAGLDIFEALRFERDTDYLTGLWNRRGLEEQVRSARELRGHVLLVDIDHFKQVNDTWGHPRGDEVLRAVAGVLRASVRSETIIARIGGEEFVLVIPGSLSDAEACAERVRQAVLAADVLGERNDLHVSVSIGVAPLRRDLSPALRGADLALYAAKRAGRNTVRLASGQDYLPITN